MNFQLPHQVRFSINLDNNLKFYYHSFVTFVFLSI